MCSTTLRRCRECWRIVLGVESATYQVEYGMEFSLENNLLSILELGINC